jgi:aminoglycoside phosphotransferase family enzyme/predicted kinase
VIVSATEAIVAALARPESYPHHPESVEVRETHISYVFLAGDRAYKLKKPVVLDFLDYGTAALRREMCVEEVRLNRRLAQDIYVGVRGVAPTADGVLLTSEDDPSAIDFVVEMRRYDERQTVAARLERGELEREHVTAVGQTLARFHADAQRVPASTAPLLTVERRFERNLHELLTCVDQRAEVAQVHALERFAHAFVAAHGRTIYIRAREGRIREGHGDLRAEHVVIDGEVRIVDCVEFDRELRELDVADDLAFLVFDLTARGGERFAQTLVRAYRDAGGDPGDDALIAFYAAYRALVRAKVALVRAAQLPPTSAERGRESAQARDLVVVAERFAWRARLPLVIVVCGVPASGKSHLAAELAAISGMPHISSDETRKGLLGIRPTERASAETYAAGWNTRTYAALAGRASEALAAERGAIVDATFRHLADRDAFRSAFGSRAPLLFIECQAPGRVLVERAARRDRQRERTSDADVAVVARERGKWEPLDEVPAGGHLVVRTDRPLEEIVGDVLALFDRRLANLHLGRK